MIEKPLSGEPTNDPSNQESPRTLVVQVGFLFQLIGFPLAGGSCCLWALSGQFTPTAQIPADRWLDYFAGSRLPTAVATICLIAGFIGGIALVAAGVGLQGERRGSGRSASFITGTLAALYWTAAVVLLAVGHPLGYAVVPIIVALAMTLLMILSLSCARTLRAHPPPPDQNVITDEQLEKLAKHRRHGGTGNP